MIALAPLSPAKLPVGHPFFPILALHQFWPLRLLPKRRRIICLICLFAIFGLNGLTCSVLLFITSNFGSWYADCRAFCPGPSSYEDRTLAAWSKKKKLQVDRCAEECLHTLPIPWKQNQEAYQLRYVFGYAMEGSDLPCYILWPTRTAEQSFWCIDAWKGDWVRLDKCAYMAPLGIEHFFDAFCFDPQRPCLDDRLGC